MPKGGKLMLETENVAIDAAYAQTVLLAPGDYVKLSVSDTGEGMPPAVRERAFEPFFTTKEKGKGTGLGLAMVYGFTKQSGGHTSIYSEQGVGTTVKLYLPRYHLDAAAESQAPSAAGATQGNGETILVVEDDARVRRLTVARLTELGYRVLEASGGVEALDMLARTDAIDLVFTDLVMPDMSGYELAGRVREDYPTIGLLLTSGYSEDLANSDRLATEKLSLLRKPYRLADLAEAIRRGLVPD